MGSELIYRGHDSQLATDSYSPKPIKPWFAVTQPIRYMLREQRLVFVLVGIAIATLFFTVIPTSYPASYGGARGHVAISDSLSYYPVETYQRAYNPRVGFGAVNSGGKIPLGLKRKGLRIVVTGGAGFVGSHLVDRLIARGDSVIVVDNFFTGRKENVMHHFGNPNFELIRHDVVEPLLLERVGARFLLTSTSEVYGDPLQHPQKETYWGNVNPIGVRSCYDEGKRTAETLTMDYHRGAGVEVRIARIFNTYGPRMCIDDGRVVSNFVAQALRKEPLTVYGDGKQTRSFQFVSDLVEGLMRLMEGEHVGPFNLGNPGEFTMLELAQVVQETIDPNAKIEFRPNTEDDPHKRKPDISRAKELLGWEPKVSLRKGLPKMVKDFRQRIFGDHKEGGAGATPDTTSSA
ncbi:UDP-glucuronic acid decarboxylase 2 [Citrus sinensis]|uniref:UDP-glucuronic acid decarboxylase 2 n=1 Tax=Citrus sinensis TaxID=2711 RepID=A0ACB8MLB9_CITSI|nr:UDP-glucuronic acid decarboxylase 2 [Citrus sinensis]